MLLENQRSSVLAYGARPCDRSLVRALPPVHMTARLVSDRMQLRAGTLPLTFNPAIVGEGREFRVVKPNVNYHISHLSLLPL